MTSLDEVFGVWDGKEKAAPSFPHPPLFKKRSQTNPRIELWELVHERIGSVDPFTGVSGQLEVSVLLI